MLEMALRPKLQIRPALSRTRIRIIKLVRMVTKPKGRGLTIIMKLRMGTTTTN